MGSSMSGRGFIQERDVQGFLRGDYTVEHLDPYTTEYRPNEKKSPGMVRERSIAPKVKKMSGPGRRAPIPVSERAPYHANPIKLQMAKAPGHFSKIPKPERLIRPFGRFGKD